MELIGLICIVAAHKEDMIPSNSRHGDNTEEIDMTVRKSNGIEPRPSGPLAPGKNEALDWPIMGSLQHGDWIKRATRLLVVTLQTRDALTTTMSIRVCRLCKQSPSGLCYGCWSSKYLMVRPDR